MKRLFIALPLSPTAAGSLWESWDCIRSSSRNIRWVKPDQFHLTLVFMGDMNEQFLPDIAEIMEEAGFRFSPVSITTGGPGHFPPGKSPRVLFESLESGGGEIGKIRKFLSGRISEFQSLEKRKFHPHITMARIKPGRDVPSGYHPGMTLPPLSDVLTEIVLYESLLKPEGAVYYDLHRTSLAGKD